MLFVGTFFICLFIFMMQFLWRYVDELVGKGLDMSVIAQFFFYSALTLVPISLPLAILLASLITFGNFGERYELLAMKAAGISLLKIMRPLAFFVCGLVAVSFYFQNVVGPIAQTKLYTLIISMKQKSPELDIPEGVFYSEIPDYNLKIAKKNRKTGMMYDVMIYNLKDGFENAHIIYADSGRMEMTADKQHLWLHLYSGDLFENLRAQNMKSQNVPYRREEFREKHTIIEFDSDFNMADASIMSNTSAAKDMSMLQASIDSMKMVGDSIGRQYYREVSEGNFRTTYGLTKEDTVKIMEANITEYNIDSLYEVAPLMQKQKIISAATSRAENLSSDINFKSYTMGSHDYSMRKHEIEWHKKITISLSCLLFFFIGAPLGGIIRKGGLGMPVIVSVMVFIIYYIIDNMGFKMARDGVWDAWEGMWLSSVVLTPMGIFLTYKAVKDSVILNADTYVNALKNLIGKREGRKVERKEVIIYTPDYEATLPKLEKLVEESTTYLANHKRWINYLTFWRQGGKDNTAELLAQDTENIVEELSNSDQNLLLNKLMDYPIIGGYNSKLSEHINGKLALAIGIFLPLGLPIYLLATYQRKLLRHDIVMVQKTSKELINMIYSLHLLKNNSDINNQ